MRVAPERIKFFFSSFEKSKFKVKVSRSPVQTAILRVVRGVLADDSEHGLGSDVAVAGVGANNGLTVAPGTIK